MTFRIALTMRTNNVLQLIQRMTTAKLDVIRFLNLIYLHSKVPW